MEGQFVTQMHGAGLHLFGIPDQKAGETKYSVEIPGALSLLLYGDPHARVAGLDMFGRADWPPVLPTFLAFHLMVGIAFALLGLIAFSLFLLARRKLFQQRWLLWIFVFSVLAPYAANEAGWATAEIGRQPWTVYGLLRTTDSLSKSVQGGSVLTSIILFGIVYVLLFAVWISVMNDKVQRGPDQGKPPGTGTPGGLLEAAAELRTPGGESLTDAHAEVPGSP
jgi:cytochrome d ubiquinol oxidase subunit I